MRRLLLAVTAVATIVAAACGDGPSGPGPLPTPVAPQITCGSSITVNDVTSGTQPVSYAPPSVVGGALPVTTICSPESGAAFPLGDTTVTCTATDALGRGASCSFAVTLRHRTLAVTNVLAFGDSITEGENGRPVNFVPFIDTPNAYPTILQRMFDERIPGQQISVVNAGRGGERVTGNDQRLKDRIAAHQPQVLLFLEGVNDLGGGLSPAAVADGVRASIRTARDRGVQYVFASTLLPTATGNCLPPPAVPRCRGNDIPIALIMETNQRIRDLVPASGAHLVDPYDEFVANSATYVDVDGLHLRPEGNRALANAFWNRLVAVIPAQQLMSTMLVPLP